MIAHSSAKKEQLRDLWHMQGVLRVKSGQPDAAVAAFRHSLRLHADIGVGMQQVALLATHGYHRQAIDWLETVEKLPRPQGWRDRLRSLDYEMEVRRIRRNIEEDLQGFRQECSFEANRRKLPSIDACR
jgi:hypothetical protein